MKLLITGVNGFVGRYLVDMIPTYFNDHETEIYGTYFVENQLLSEMKAVNLHYMDLQNKESVKKVIEEVNPDYVFHLAAQSSVSLSWKNPNLTFNVNVNGTINLLDAIREKNINCRVLVVGSSDEYGVVSRVPISEDDALNPQNPYAISKVSQELITKLYCKAYDMKIILTRSFNHFGPYQEPVFVIADWAKQIAEIEKGLREPLISVGNIDVVRDFTDVRDIINAYMKLISEGIAGEIYNVGSGNGYSLKDILSIMVSLSSTNITVKVDETKLRPVENPVIQCDNSKISQAIQWNIDYEIEKSLYEVINYWRKIIK